MADNDPRDPEAGLPETAAPDAAPSAPDNGGEGLRFLGFEFSAATIGRYRTLFDEQKLPVAFHDGSDGEVGSQ